ncbi:MAG: 50S ribosomal protein L9 [Waddliaceae bacterium]
MAQKLLLVKDVKDLGRSGDIVKVKPGYARNYLLPKGLAMIASKHALRLQERLQEDRLKKAAQDRKEAEVLAERLKEVTLESVVKIDQEGHMYGSVSLLDVVRLLQEQQQIVIDKHSVQLKHPIKTIGIHTIEFKLDEDVTAAVRIKVMSEEEATPPPSNE